MWRVLALLAGAVVGWAPPGAAFNVLVLHPLHSGSHEVQLRHLALTLAQRGHSVTYLKFKNFVQLPPLPHPNITSITLAVDNSLNTIPYVTPEKEGRSAEIKYSDAGRQEIAEAEIIFALLKTLLHFL